MPAPSTVRTCNGRWTERLERGFPWSWNIFSKNGKRHRPWPLFQKGAGPTRAAGKLPWDTTGLQARELGNSLLCISKAIPLWKASRHLGV